MVEAHDNCGFGLIAHKEGQASHRLLRLALQGLSRMQHRGGVAADGRTGDGCGLLLSLPTKFFRAVAEENGFRLAKRFAVGMVFLPQDPARAKAIIADELAKETLTIAGWRPVPVDESVLGYIALHSKPVIEQVLVNAPPGWRKRELERRLYMARRRAEKRLEAEQQDAYMASLSCVVIVYKALTLAADLPRFYTDLTDLRMESTMCLFHQRFSTNTLPRWELAQPFRYLAHNGEINTISGNRHWARARSHKFASPLLPDLQTAKPFVSSNGSDSQAMDNMLDLLLSGGMDLFRAMRLIMPPAWEQDPVMADDVKAFFEFNSMHMEPWDGPAGVVMADGRYAACQLDRNGLRPARWVETSDGLITLASEVGIWDYAEDEVIAKGRVGPGQLLAVDTFKGQVWFSDAIDRDLAGRHPYREWLSENHTKLTPFEDLSAAQAGIRDLSDDQLKKVQKYFGLTREEIHDVVEVLGRDGKEAVGSMGDDTPLAGFSKTSRSLFDYFRQRFAQVTNPPIDPLREAFVMSLTTYIGAEQNVFCETSGHAERVQFKSPVLLYSDLRQLLDKKVHKTLSLAYPKDGDLKEAIIELCDDAENAVKDGAVLVLLSDRHIHADQLMIPAPLAVGAVQERLVDRHLRASANLFIETGSVRDPHHFAVLLGLGATAVYPYLAFESLAALVDAGMLDDSLKSVLIKYRNGINGGLKKILSKMGISTIASYRGAALFDVLGLDDEVCKLCFPGLRSPIGGKTFAAIQQQSLAVHNQAFMPGPLPLGGLLKFQPGGEYHAWNPDVVRTLQTAVRSDSWEAWQQYAKAVHQGRDGFLRDKLSFKANTKAIEVEQVEAAEKLFPRMDTAAMSIGALSPEAHIALAIAMNRLGGRSNSGEGGEDPKRRRSEGRSKIRQVASGRFGVTPEYLATAEVIQIKMAQGAKPGEGGQLPGHKVSVEIAKLRHSTPGTTLISPPPHHDIYSIEDLAQLIYDLKTVNPEALVSVKLVSSQGVGTIACGVAKAGADLITLSGYDGGTGASPLTSVKYAGGPWELGLVDAHHALIKEGLRDQVILQVDGGFKTGQDVVKAAIMGADSFGFGTAPMVALGCKYLRICHLNNCATGVATQHTVLRDKHFRGLPEQVESFFTLMAREIRELLASLGVASLDEAKGRLDLLECSDSNIGKVLLKPLPALPDYEVVLPVPEHSLNDKILAEAQLDTPWLAYYPISNTDRTVPATLSGAIAKTYGDSGCPQPIRLQFRGTAGQSFGAFSLPGMEVRLVGDANDYVGKGLGGGTLVLSPPPGSHFVAADTLIMGNTCLFGATGGECFAEGQAGERFGVRNSGATAVVEGVGDHGCEYMTAGMVVVLGKTGRNFAAGMTGGLAVVLDLDDRAVNNELVQWCPLSAHSDITQQVRALIKRHQNLTGSVRAGELLEDADWAQRFTLIHPQGWQPQLREAVS
ncbi:glutamate synthase large subunit [Gallaecimonas pentaromativorans]|uniref:Glutamate synthase [NADPH] large chain n=1 Tax=Gallaecimonas pentaromativorans TaxID=584787 RepID=A0A3N1PTJ6_9GAMM|nr:glutamate synthase large subunit [Gallaecimonas pentaromativorans]ROQ30431.1 glutamate synthase (NADPH) large subunit [Gallaecimonas pentaromativorans]